MVRTQLLCTFCTEDTLDETIEQIVSCYTVAFKSIYILENVDEDGELCCTYNIEADVEPRGSIPLSTISLHRKKHTNTLYTINALNKLIAEQNNGEVDKSFQVEWDELRNMILVTQYGHLKRINTKIQQVMKLDEW